MVSTNEPSLFVNIVLLIRNQRKENSKRFSMLCLFNGPLREKKMSVHSTQHTSRHIIVWTNFYLQPHNGYALLPITQTESEPIQRNSWANQAINSFRQHTTYTTYYEPWTLDVALFEVITRWSWYYTNHKIKYFDVTNYSCQWNISAESTEHTRNFCFSLHSNEWIRIQRTITTMCSMHLFIHVFRE